MNVHPKNYKTQFFFRGSLYQISNKLIIFVLYIHYAILGKGKNENLLTLFIGLVTKLDKEERLSDDSLDNREEIFK